MKLSEFAYVVVPGEMITLVDIGGNKLAEFESGSSLQPDNQEFMNCNVDGVFTEVNDTVGLPGFTVILERGV